MEISITFYAQGLLNFLRLFGQRVASGTANPEVRGAVQRAGRAYLTDMRERFAREGDGSWKPLAKHTQQQRAWLGFQPAHPILRRLGILADGLIPGAPGNVFEVMPDGVRMGYGGDYVHPGYRTPRGKIIGGDVRLADIARYHQLGTGRMPARPIFVQPSDQALQQMSQRMIEGYRALVATTVADSQPAGPVGMQNAA